MNTLDLFRRIGTASPADAETLRHHPAAYTSEALPFYSRFRLLRARAWLRHRPVEFHYADDGNKLVVLAEPADIYAVDDMEALRLDASNVPAYLHFYFEMIAHGTCYLVETPEQVDWLDPSVMEAEERERMETAKPMIHPLVVAERDAGAYHVKSTAVAQRTLLELDLAVGADGRVQELARQVLAEQIPVPDVVR